MATKARPFKVKAADDGEGIIEAIVATYDVDSVGDRIVPGAFSKSLDEWAESGNPIPFIWSHQHNDLDAYLGDVLEAKETDDGLWVRAQLDMDDAQTRKAYRMIKGGRIRNYSFAYDVLDEGPADAKDGEPQVNELRQLKLYEVGPTLIGANQETRTLTAKQRRKNDRFADPDDPAGPDDGDDAKEKVSDKPWSNFGPSDYDDQQWKRACLLDRGEGEGKSRYALPVREPDGTLNRNGCHAAASVLGGGRGGVSATPEQKAAAARKLISLYKSQLDEDPPESLVEAAKTRAPHGSKVGRRLSKANEDSLRQAAQLITDVLASIDGEDPAENAQPATPAKDEDRSSGKSKEPTSPSPVDLLRLISIQEQE